MAPTPPTPPALAADATQADKDKAKSEDDVAINTYDRKAHEYSNALEAYRQDLTAYTQWMDDDARAAAVLTSSVLQQFASEFMGLGTVADMVAGCSFCARYSWPSFAACSIDSFVARFATFTHSSGPGPESWPGRPGAWISPRPHCTYCNMDGHTSLVARGTVIYVRRGRLLLLGCMLHLAHQGLLQLASPSRTLCGDDPQV
ncbi:hypothetical protein QYE76_056813 [Lolium multiflorum]|uniref:Uncharacterized protein n=1 Tax=Lolium multiflorum TaxID=4521 RepID=A0AAD8T3G2_LOLMU|nr:hypothetical protein QYE76_056813 [Lolium multiflorum]